MIELRRTMFSGRRLWAFLLLPTLCFAMFLLERMGGGLTGGWGRMWEEGETYRANVVRFAAMTTEEAAEDYSEYYGPDEALSGEPDLRDTKLHVASYDEYLSRVSAQAEKLRHSRIFGGDPGSFNYRNIQKTAKDFSRLQGIQLTFGGNRAVEKWLRFQSADLMFAFGILILVMAFSEDRRRNLAPLLRACPGGWLGLETRRLGILAVVSAALTLGLYLPNLWFAFRLYGGKETLSNAVQSLVGFRTCTLRLTLGQWLLLYFAARMASGVFLGLLFRFLLSFLRQMQLAWLIIAAILAAEYIAYTQIQPYMALAPLKLLNVFTLVYPADSLKNYVNINLAGYPFGHTELFLLLLTVGSVLLLFGNLWIAQRRHPFGGRNLLGRPVLLWNTFCDRFRIHFGLFAMECSKQLFLGGTILFLLAGLLLGQRLSFRGSVYYNGSSYSYAQYMKEIAGPVTEKAITYISEAREKAAHYPEYADSVEKLAAEVARIEKQAEAGGYEPWLLDQVELNNIFGEKSRGFHMLNAIVAGLLTILCTAPLFSLEAGAGTEKLIRATERGRGRLLLAKYGALWLEIVLIWAAVYLPQWKKTADFIGRELLLAPLGNIDALHDFPIRTTIGGFLATLSLFRLIALGTVAHLAAWFSAHVSAWTKAALSAVGLMLLPALLCCLGQSWAAVLTPLIGVSGLELLNGTGALRSAVWTSAVGFLLALLLTYRAVRRWCAAE